MKITEKLFELQDEKYGDFQCKLTPGIDRDRIIGGRVPILRKLAKSYINDDECDEFLNHLPHRYYDENMLHGILISEIKNFDRCVEELEKFLPFVDNWAVCDTTAPKVFRRNREKLMKYIEKWSSSKETYTCRFAIEMLMTHFLDDDFREAYLEIPAEIISEEYYVNMMVAWFFATALAKQWDKTISYIEENRLGQWVHNKTIQKARESYRITEEQKEYLKSLKK